MTACPWSSSPTIQCLADPNTPGPAVQEIIADSRNDFDSYPVSTRVNNTRNDFPELLVPLKA